MRRKLPAEAADAAPPGSRDQQPIPARAPTGAYAYGPKKLGIPASVMPHGRRFIEMLSVQGLETVG